MASRPLTICRAAGCQETTREGYCPTHAASKPSSKEYDQQHVADRSFYWSTAWRRLRAAYLTANPLCLWCLSEGRVELATEVDHRKPRRDYPQLALDPNNLRGGCKSCHSKHGAKAKRPR